MKATDIMFLNLEQRCIGPEAEQEDQRRHEQDARWTQEAVDRNQLRYHEAWVKDCWCCNGEAFIDQFGLLTIRLLGISVLHMGVAHSSQDLVVLTFGGVRGLAPKNES